ncbi:MAG: FAD-dependent oxidoreductase, partial [Bryobacteraceae bacterium]
AYNFRMILTNDPANRIAFSKPPDYDPYRYELLARLLEAKMKQAGKAPQLREVTLIALIPNHKADFNNNGPFSTDYIGKSWDYPNASYARRREIWMDHTNYTKGFFYFLADDPRVPESLREETNSWGLPKDEFLDTDHWPHQLYIREARRMVSDFVMTQKDVQTDITKPDPIGMGSYNSDSHNVQRILKPDGTVENEGDMQVPVKPYQIPYRVMIPKRTEATNLLVPVCFSASHVAYSSLRMEPQYMMLGQAAGLAAALAVRSQKNVQDIDVTRLVGRLKEQGVIMEYHPAPPPPPSVRELFKKITANVSYSPEFF